MLLIYFVSRCMRSKKVACMSRYCTRSLFANLVASDRSISNFPNTLVLLLFFGILSGNDFTHSPKFLMVSQTCRTSGQPWFLETPVITHRDVCLYFHYKPGPSPSQYFQLVTLSQDADHWLYGHQSCIVQVRYFSLSARIYMA